MPLAKGLLPNFNAIIVGTLRTFWHIPQIARHESKNFFHFQKCMKTETIFSATKSVIFNLANNTELKGYIYTNGGSY